VKGVDSDVRLIRIGPSMTSASDGAAFLAEVLGVPIPVPAELMSAPLHQTYGIGIADRTGRIEGNIVLEVAEERVYLQYGVATFDGCGGDAAHPTNVLDRPALCSRHPGQTTLIWPATSGHPDGRFGITAAQNLKPVIRWAEEMESSTQVARTEMLSGC
jgi:hypothetical protein